MKICHWCSILMLPVFTPSVAANTSGVGPVVSWAGEIGDLIEYAITFETDIELPANANDIGREEDSMAGMSLEVTPVTTMQRRYLSLEILVGDKLKATVQNHAQKTASVGAEERAHELEYTVNRSGSLDIDTLTTTDRNVTLFSALLIRIPSASLSQNGETLDDGNIEIRNSVSMCLIHPDADSKKRIDSFDSRLTIKTTRAWRDDDGDLRVEFDYSLEEALYFNWSKLASEPAPFLPPEGKERLRSDNKRHDVRAEFCGYHGRHVFNVSEGRLESANGTIHSCYTCKNYEEMFDRGSEAMIERVSLIVVN